MKKLVFLTLGSVLIATALFAVPKETFTTNTTAVQAGTNPEIVGSWVLENDPNYKISFSATGIMKEYENNVMLASYTYSISNSCGTESDPEHQFLKKIDEDNNKFCFEINGINVENSNRLSLTSMINGKVYVYYKVN